MKRRNNPENRLFRPTRFQQELIRVYAPESEEPQLQSPILSQYLHSVNQVCLSLANSARFEVDNGNHTQMIDRLHGTLISLNNSRDTLDNQALTTLQGAYSYFESWSRSTSSSSNGRQKLIKNINREFRQLIAFLGKKYR